MKRVETYEPGPGAEGNAGTGGAASGRREASPESHSFVKFFMQASPYIAGHRGKTFVVVVPGEAFEDPAIVEQVLDNLSLLHSLRVRVVLVLGCFPQLQQRLAARGVSSSFHGEYRITCPASLVASMEAAGVVRALAEARLSKGPSVAMVRRHQRTMQAFHFRPVASVSSGNFVVAKRRGVVDGVDFGQTGEVRLVAADDIQALLERDHIVLVSNLGASAGGHVLNCNIYEVATATATALQADKIIFHTLNDIEQLELPKWLRLQDAEDLIRQFAFNRILARGPSRPGKPLPASPADVPVDLDSWFVEGAPWELSCAVAALRAGVKRAHLVDIRDRGGLLLELYTRDGVGTMVSRDFYEGCRHARPDDLQSIDALLHPLVEAGILAPRSLDDISRDLAFYYVIERDARVLACAFLVPLPDSDGGPSGMAEVGAFVVDSKYRGGGRGDALLEYLEQQARDLGIRELVLLTTRTADWFMQRGFQHAGIAHLSNKLPEPRRAKINPGRNSQLYFKVLGQDEDEEPSIEASEDLKAVWRGRLAP